MENFKHIKHLSQLFKGAGKDRYRGALIDAWGVIHNGVRLFDGSKEALLKFRKEIGPVIILTNAPRPSSIIPGQLDRLGLPRDAYDGIVTSGDAIRAEIQKHLAAPIFRLGPDKDDELYKGLKINFAPIEEAQFIICTGLLDEHGDEKPEDYTEIFIPAIERGVVMICANPDIVVRWGDRMIYCAGALAHVYEQLGGQVIHGGKPHSPIYALAMQRMLALDSSIDSSTILAIGDGLGTDVLGANNHGIDVLYICGDGGIHQQGEGTIEDILRTNNAHAIGAAESLRW